MYYYNVNGNIGQEPVDETYSNIEHAKETARLVDSGYVAVVSPHRVRQKALVVEHVMHYGTPAFDEFCAVEQILYRVNGWLSGADMPMHTTRIFEDESSAREFARKCEGSIEVINGRVVKRMQFEEQEYFDFCYPEASQATFMRSTHEGVEQVPAGEAQQ